MRLSPEQLAGLLAMVSARTGKSPEALLELLRGGDISSLTGLLGADGERARELFASGRAEELLAMPAVAELLAKLLR